FDGVHRGHRALFQRLAALAAANGWKPSVLTFDPHPARVLAPAHAPKLLSTIEQRCRWMAEAGVRQVLVLRFDAAVAALTPEEFAGDVLMTRLGARAVLVGENFRFGRGAAGDVALLRRIGRERGVIVEVVGGVLARGRLISSTEIRRLIEKGKVSMAARLLGRPYALEGRVIPGHGVGARSTVPTLNLDTTAEVLPAAGVYVSRTQSWPSVTNVGYRPTFNGDKLSIESFVLEGLPSPAPGEIRVEFLLRLRDERKFPDPAALKAQIMRDVARAQSYFRRLRAAGVRPCT
ncbi:MAG: riboflavin biosynthesis protein RibF, partial [Bryobacteraceae bacterium]